MRGQIFGGVDGGHHTLHCQKSCKVGCVAGDDDESEEPPAGAYDAAGNGLGGNVASLLHESGQRKPEGVEQTEVVGHGAAAVGVKVWRVTNGLVAMMEDPPLIRREPGHDEQHDADAYEGEDHADLKQATVFLSDTVQMLASVTQISCERGLRKLKTPGFCFIGFLIMMEMPRDMKGLLKSMTRSLSEVMVMGAMVKSAS